MNLRSKEMRKFMRWAAVALSLTVSALVWADEHRLKPVSQLSTPGVACPGVTMPVPMRGEALKALSPNQVCDLATGKVLYVEGRTILTRNGLRITLITPRTAYSLTPRGEVVATQAEPLMNGGCNISFILMVTSMAAMIVAMLKWRSSRIYANAAVCIAAITATVGTDVFAAAAIMAGTAVSIAVLLAFAVAADAAVIAAFIATAPVIDEKIFLRGAWAQLVCASIAATLMF